MQDLDIEVFTPAFRHFQYYYYYYYYYCYYSSELESEAVKLKVCRL